MERVPEDIHKIIAKKLSGEANDLELKIFNEWLDSSDKAKDEYREFLYIWKKNFLAEKNIKIVSQDETREKIWEEVFGEISCPHYKHFNFVWWLKIAAVLIMFITVAFGIGSLIRVTEHNKPIIKIITKQAPPGQKSTVTLADGSVVWLNSKSKISYRSDFNDSIRIIHLEGQAYFEVFKDKTRPFIVKCKNIEIEAVGTSFDVDGFKDKMVQVSLLTGKVRLTAHHNAYSKEIVLYPGEYSIVDTDNRLVENGKFDPYYILAWKEGRLIFSNETLEEIIPELELWFGVKIEKHLTKKTTKRFSGTFERENLDNILYNMGTVMGFDYKIKDNKVVIKN